MQSENCYAESLRVKLGSVALQIGKCWKLGKKKPYTAFFICTNLQETLGALCCTVSASCLSWFLTHFSGTPPPPPFHHLHCVWQNLFPLVEGQHLVTHTRTHTHTHTRKCCSSGSCELQCCSLIQGKCQTQEKSFKYRHFQSFCFLWQPLRSPGTSPCLGTGPAQLHGLCSRSSRCQEKTGPCHTWGCIIWYQNALCWHSV